MTKQQLAEKISRLSMDDRLLLSLLYVEELSITEAALVLDISVDSAVLRLGNALERLADNEGAT